MTEAFPTFNLEDKVAAKGEGIVTNANELRVDMGNDKNTEAGASPSGQVAANSLVAGVRKSERIKITNSRWKDYV
ncbi:unnamed protein product [Sphenostylis stenocarpa]|uniref:Uncharacterized protein n=1 Tax=Sphenostylis stenocarpa TaxID=92480 RepID=A0AA86SSQ3_9FABA|nr:unnamed protein product [Sphenostylis stenocarpa]